jgi:hypothetical protein
VLDHQDCVQTTGTQSISSPFSTLTHVRCCIGHVICYSLCGVLLLYVTKGKLPFPEVPLLV